MKLRIIALTVCFITQPIFAMDYRPEAQQDINCITSKDLTCVSATATAALAFLAHDEYKQHGCSSEFRMYVCVVAGFTIMTGASFITTLYSCSNNTWRVH